jgi:hypothetical protein
MLDWISFNLKKMSQAASRYEDAESDECDYHRVGLSDCYAQGPFTPPAGKKRTKEEVIDDAGINWVLQCSVRGR